MKHYHKYVEWSEKDGIFIGRCPEIMLGGVHGKDEVKVYRELCQVVREWVKIDQKDKAKKFAKKKQPA